jgi:hypothetical protein
MGTARGDRRPRRRDRPERARKACKALTGAADDPQDGTAGERLLADLREIFGDAGAGFLCPATIIDRLAGLAGCWA